MRSSNSGNLGDAVPFTVPGQIRSGKPKFICKEIYNLDPFVSKGGKRSSGTTELHYQ